MKQENTHYFGGLWHRSHGKPMKSINPATESVVWQGNEATVVEVDMAVEAARETSANGAATVADALEALRNNEDLLEQLNTIFLVDASERLVASIPLARLFVAPADTPLTELASDPLIQAPVGKSQNRVAEQFDKYNLLTLPVVDEEGKLAGVITADDIISVLRQK